MKVVRAVPQTDAAGRRRGTPLTNDFEKEALWAFYHSQPDRVIVKVAFIKIRVRDLKPLFEALAGPEPE